VQIVNTQLRRRVTALYLAMQDDPRRLVIVVRLELLLGHGLRLKRGLSAPDKHRAHAVRAFRGRGVGFTVAPDSIGSSDSDFTVSSEPANAAFHRDDQQSEQ
jgi:hypothetical protein